MPDLEKRRADRLLVMKAIYDASEGSEGNFVSGPDLLESIGLSDQELGDACKFLEGEYLIKGTRTLWGHVTPFVIQITHRGIREMEESIQAPTMPTEHFPPAVSIINVQGDIIGSPIQSGSPGARQEVSIGDINLGGVRDFLDQLEKIAPSIPLPVEESQELAADIATIRAQIDSPRPKKQIVRESLHSVRSILEGAGGSVAAVGLIEALQHLHF